MLGRPGAIDKRMVVMACEFKMTGMFRLDHEIRTLEAGFHPCAKKSLELNLHDTGTDLAQFWFKIGFLLI